MTREEVTTIHPLKTPEILLLGPGPSNSYPGVLEAISEPTLGHLDPFFFQVMDEIRENLQYLFCTQSPHTYVVSGPGSLGMETCFVNLVEPGDKIIVCHNGFFGDRMHENARRFGADIVSVKGEWGQPIDVAAVRATFEAHPDTKLLSVVHAETSTGVRNDVEALAKLAKEYNALIIVDAVTALGAIPLKVDEWGLDAVYSCSQKGVGSVPGMSPVAFSTAAFDKVKQRKTPVSSWFQDICVYDNYWKPEPKRTYHHTAPAQQFYAILAALRYIRQQGLEKLWAEHQAIHEYFAQEMQSRGWKFFVDEPHRLPQLNTMLLPEGLDDVTGRTKLRQQYNIEVGAGLGAMAGKLWRIGIMGGNVNKTAIEHLLNAIDQL